MLGRGGQWLSLCHCFHRCRSKELLEQRNFLHRVVNVLCACRGSLLCDFTEGLAGGMFGSKMPYEVWCPSLHLPVFGFIWKWKEIRGLFVGLFFFFMCFPSYSLNIYICIYEGWSKERDLGEKRTCQPLRQTNFSPPHQAVFYRERDFCWSLARILSLVLPSLISEQEKGGAGAMLLLWLSLSAFPRGTGWASFRQGSY